MDVVSGSRRLEVQLEVEKFLLALRSYPDCFASDPHLSFEEHVFSVMASRSAHHHVH